MKAAVVAVLRVTCMQVHCIVSYWLYTPAKLLSRWLYVCYSMKPSAWQADAERAAVGWHHTQCLHVNADSAAASAAAT